MIRAQLFACTLVALAGCQGTEGIQGPPGPRGAMGDSGNGAMCWDTDGDGACSGGEDVDRSTKCDVGDCRGPQGLQGPAGVAGVEGPVGTTGPQGAVGPAGPEGVAGQRGVTGAVGPSGAVGSVGPQGAVGPAGPKGSRVALVAEYELDEAVGSTSFADTGGLSNSMSGNAPAVVAGSAIAHSGKSIALTGLEGVVAADGNTIPDSAQIWPEMWIRPTDPNPNYTLIEKTGGYKLRMTGAQLQWTVTTAGGPCSVTHPGLVSANVWTHVSGWYDGLTLYVEMNGAPQSVTCKTGRVAATVGTQMTIGGKLGGAWSEVFRGNIDEVRVRGVAPYVPQDVSSIKGPIWRWTTFHTFQQSYGWWWNNNAGMETLGINPSTWTDGNAQIDQISSNKDWLRSVLVRTGRGGKNAMVIQDHFYPYSSTDGPVTIAMFRIRNTTNSAITWTPTFVNTYYASWSERASIALNGVNQWTSGGSDCNQAACQSSVAMSIPAARVSSVLFASLGGQPSGFRSNVLGIINDTAQLPDGLVYVDDFDTMTGDWSQ